MPGLNAWQGRKEHQDPALASEGSIAQQAGGAAIDTEEEKLLLLLLLLPNRLSSFSCPALPCSGGRAVQERSRGTVGPSPAHPSLGSASPPGAALGSGRAQSCDCSCSGHTTHTGTASRGMHHTGAHTALVAQREGPGATSNCPLELLAAGRPAQLAPRFNHQLSRQLEADASFLLCEPRVTQLQVLCPWSSFLQGG